MILVVSAARTAEVSFLSLRELEELVAIPDELDEVATIPEELLELSVSVTLESLDGSVQDDDAGKELADDDCSTSEELNSSTGVALLPSSPQATRPIATESSIAGNANRFILTS